MITITDAFKCKSSDWFKAQSSCFVFWFSFQWTHILNNKQHIIVSWFQCNRLTGIEYQVAGQADKILNEEVEACDLKIQITACRFFVFLCRNKMRTISGHFHFYKQYFYMSGSICDLSAGTWQRNSITPPLWISHLSLQTPTNFSNLDLLYSDSGGKQIALVSLSHFQPANTQVCLCIQQKYDMNETLIKCVNAPGDTYATWSIHSVWCMYVVHKCTNFYFSFY